MLHLTSRQLLLSVLALFVLLIFARFVSVMSFPDSTITLEKGEPIKIFPDQSIRQTFTAKRNGLAKIEFLLRTPGPNRSDIVQMTIADQACTTPLRRSILEPSFLNSDNLYEAAFAPLPDSRGRQYCVSVTYQKAGTSTKYLRFFTMASTDETTTLTPASGEPMKSQTLAMRPVYNNASVWQDLRELTERVSQYKPFFLKDAFIATLALSSVVTSVGLIVILILLI